jgi:glycosyltransferase involved in cell wall biosynthesis
MKILLSSHFFHPSVGGIEEVSRNLACEFAKIGHEVKVITSTRELSDIDFPFEIIRRPSPLELIRLVRWCDVYFHNNISLKTAWPLLFVRKPWVIAHHTWIARMNGRRGIRDWIKQRVSKAAMNISISGAVAEHIRVPSVIIGNPYRDQVFKMDANAARERDLVFLGRLVWDKGADLLLDALSILKQRGVTPQLTIIGDGAARESLKRQCKRLGLEAQVDFAGTHTGEDLAALLNTHKIMVIPSRWQEPFGLVALEGIACGCVPIGAECGGLTDAIGPAGITFPCGEIEPLARAIELLLNDKKARIQYRQVSEEHLSQNNTAAVARKYLKVLERAAR